MTSSITSFRGQYGFLSNFYPATIDYAGDIYPSSEHAYQAMKTADREQREFIRNCKTPGQAKRAGQQVSKRPDFELLKLVIMEEIVYLKFQRNEHLKKLLLATGDAILVEGNHWGDIFWGECNGRGKNHLGKILMKVREKLAV